VPNTSDKENDQFPKANPDADRNPTEKTRRERKLVIAHQKAQRYQGPELDYVQATRDWRRISENILSVDNVNELSHLYLLRTFFKRVVNGETRVKAQHQIERAEGIVSTIDECLHRIRRGDSDSPHPQPSSQAISRSAAQDSAIVNALIKLGHDPKNPPHAGNTGRPGLRSEVRAMVMPEGPNSTFSDSTFNKAWGRLRQRQKQGNREK
jgi:hypothetical protein